MPAYTVIEVAISTEYMTHKYDVQANSKQEAIEIAKERRLSPSQSWPSCECELGNSGWAAGPRDSCDEEVLESKAMDECEKVNALPLCPDGDEGEG